jgi:hypothetical protein
MTNGREAAHLRKRASKCRRLAESLSSEDARSILHKLADGYEAEALRCNGTDGLARLWLYGERDKPT